MLKQGAAWIQTYQCKAHTRQLFLWKALLLSKTLYRENFVHSCSSDPKPTAQSKVPHRWVPLTGPGTGKELEVIHTSGEIQHSSLNTWLPSVQQADVPRPHTHIPLRQTEVISCGRFQKGFLLLREHRRVAKAQCQLEADRRKPVFHDPGMETRASTLEGLTHLASSIWR